MVKDSSFCIASNNIFSKRFDDEVIVMDTKSGVYFSLGGAAVDIWTHVETSSALESIKAALTARYDGDPSVIGGAVDECLAELLQNGLIRKAPPSRKTELDLASAAVKQPFVEPLIERFNDMQNLLTLDPVHEVSEEGWPLPISSGTKTS